MLKFDIEYKTKGAKVTTANAFETKSIADLVQYVKEVTVAGARVFREDAVKKYGFPEKDYLTLVDSKLGAPDTSVKPFGKIEYITKIESIAEVVVGVMELVIAKSPKRTGYYHSMNVLMYNGKIVANSLTAARVFFKDRIFKDSDKFRIINLSPYARKLERLGINSGKRGKYRSTKNKSGTRVRAPSGVYWISKNEAKRKFQGLKNNIKFSFIPVSPSVALSANRKTFTPNEYVFKKSSQKGRPYLYPSITITLAPSSFSSNAGFTEGSGSL
tara:strand:- start:234 stop:1049 length:816 start_codon:yes stop_codon:yes gene_type:complete